MLGNHENYDLLNNKGLELQKQFTSKDNRYYGTPNQHRRSAQQEEG